MTTLTNVNTTNKVIRIQDNEKELLSRLREIYANDYKKYSEYIKREPNVPLSIKKIYKLLDERKAYRRISDYFHRERIAKRARNSQSNSIRRSYHRSSTRSITQVPETMCTIPVYDEDDDNNNQQQSDSPTVTNDSDELIETNSIINDDIRLIQGSSTQSINSTDQRKRRLSPTNNEYQQLENPPTSQFSINSKSNLLSVRTSIQEALHKLDRVIISKSDDLTEEYNNKQEQSSTRQRNFFLHNHCHTKLDDIVRSLSNVVNQQQENVRLIINESSTLLFDNDKSTENFSITTQQSIKTVLERLNSLIDRGHTIYDKIEHILSDI